MPTPPPSPKSQRVAVKLPPYWPNDPTLWFAQVEAQFAIAAITQEKTMFHYVVSQLPSNMAAEVRDLILSPPSEPYKTLKATLITRTSETAAQRLKKALAATEVGDSKPTQILRVLQQQLEGMTADDKLVLQVFLQKLPPTVRSIVAAQGDKLSLSELAELADRVFEHMPDSGSISAVSSSPMEQRISRLESMMEKILSLQESAMTDHHQTRSRSRSTSRGRYRPQGSLCYYHWRFKNQAQKCTQPCSWTDRISTQKNEKEQ